MSDRAKRLFKFLREIVRIRTKTVYDIEKYEHVIPLCKVPEDKRYCFVFFRDADDETQNDVWFSVRKYNEPQKPQYPDLCRDWVNHDSEDENTFPDLHSAIPSRQRALASDEDDNHVEHEPHELRLVDFPDVRAKWDRYLEEEWWPWSEEHEKWRPVQSIYEQLFKVQQQQKRLGEEFELVIGVGLLTHVDEQNKSIRRHLLTQKAELNFNSERGLFVVKSHPTDGDIGLELDMLDSQRPDRELIQLIESELKSDKASIWDRSFIDGLLTSVVQKVYADGEYEEDVLEFPFPTKRHRVTCSPTLMLRKRNYRGLASVLDGIIGQLDGDISLPPCLVPFLGESKSTPGQDDTGDPSPAVKAATRPDDAEIYFPLPTNDEQAKILTRMERQDGVVVKGPPGTGKSHTIANLISHLLATGERILVTAQSPRALAVLQNKVPEGLQDLCVSLLGNGATEKKNLEKSVQTIIDYRENWSGREEDLDKEINTALTKLHDVRKRLAQTRNDLKELRLRESHETTISVDYKGFPMEIAQQVVEKKDEFDWMTDEIPLSTQLPCDQDELEELGRRLQTVVPSLVENFDFNIPNAEEIAQLRKFGPTFNSLEKIQSELEVLNVDRHTVPAEIQSLSVGQLVDDHPKLNESADQLRRLLSYGQWTNGVIDDFLAGRWQKWKDVRTQVKNSLDGKVDNLYELVELDIDVPDHLSRKNVRNSCFRLIGHFERGGKRKKWWFFIPKVVKEEWPNIAACSIAGRLCSDTADIKHLYEYLQAEYALEKAKQILSDLCEIQTVELLAVSREIRSIDDQLFALLKFHREITALFGKFGFSQLNDEKQSWEASSFDLVANALQASILRKEEQAALVELGLLDELLKDLEDRVNSHPRIAELRTAFDSRRTGDYEEVLDTFAELVVAKPDFDFIERVLTKLAVAAPELASEIRRSINLAAWPSRLSRMVAAWEWAQANTWMREYVELNEYSLVYNEKRFLSEEETHLLKLATFKAIRACLERLTQEKVQALVAWQQAMGRLGAGTGKYASRHRRSAQRALDQCRDTIPAWIMPLNSLYETIAPRPGMFDVIIVDEASQCNLDSLLLYYIGKKVIVVGDPEQISPTPVGIRLNVIFELAEELLFDFPELIKQSFNLDESLHDFANLLFTNGELMLKEHFRCVPEIIAYSNALSYHNKLIPLRQCSPERLEPLKRVFVEDGYRKGKDAKVYNQPEAEQIAIRIAECCADPAYDGKSMGAITLQGKAQAQLIQENLLELIGTAEIEKRKIVCGDPYSFQGDERDVIFLSMVAASNERLNSLTKKMYRQRFNVAASRARDQMWLFHSVRREEFGSNCLRRSLVEHFLDRDRFKPTIHGVDDIDELRHTASTAIRELGNQPAPFESWFEVDVALAIAEKGYQVRPQYKTGGRYIDLVIEDSGRQLAVECHGPHHLEPNQIESDDNRKRQLERIGWQFHVIWGSKFEWDPTGTIEELVKDLNRRNIHPIRALRPHADTPTEERPDVEDTPSQAVAPAPSRVHTDILDIASPESQHVVDSDKTVVPVHPSPSEVGFPDPREADTSEISQGLLRIIEQFGPLPEDTAYRRYRDRSSSVNKITAPVRKKLNIAIGALKRSEEIIALDEYGNDKREDMILRTPHCPEVKVRRGGEREFFHDIPPSEIAQVMINITKERGAIGRLSEEHLIYPTLNYYGFKQLTKKREPIFKAAYRIYCQKI